MRVQNSQKCTALPLTEKKKKNLEYLNDWTKTFTLKL